MAVALRGIVHVYRRERNFRWMTAAGVAAVAAVSVSGPVDATWWRVVTLTALILAAELGNSAIEAAVDLAEPRDHPVAAFAKDAAAGAVLVLSGFALLVAALDVWPRVRAAAAAAGGWGPWATALAAGQPVALLVAAVAGLLALAGIWRFRQTKGG